MDVPVEPADHTSDAIADYEAAGEILNRKTKYLFVALQIWMIY